MFIFQFTQKNVQSYNFFSRQAIEFTDKILQNAD